MFFGHRHLNGEEHWSFPDRLPNPPTLWPNFFLTPTVSHGRETGWEPGEGGVPVHCNSPGFMVEHLPLNSSFPFSLPRLLFPIFRSLRHLTSCF